MEKRTAMTMERMGGEGRQDGEGGLRHLSIAFHLSSPASSSSIRLCLRMSFLSYPLGRLFCPFFVSVYLLHSFVFSVQCPLSVLLSSSLSSLSVYFRRCLQFFYWVKCLGAIRLGMKHSG